jgi:hypothetical protein
MKIKEELVEAGLQKISLGLYSEKGVKIMVITNIH